MVSTTACKWDSVIPFEPMWEQLKRLIKPKGAIVLFGSQPFTSALIMSNPKMFKYSLIWNKGRGYGPGLAKYRPMPSFEEMNVFGGGAVTYNPQMRAGAPYKKANGKYQAHGANGHRLGYKPGHISESDGDRYPLSVIDISWSPSGTMHPTQKPVPLLEYLIKTYTNEGEKILDFTFGSGTTGVAAMNTNRNFVGIERDENYFKIAQKRIEEAANPAQMQLVA